MSKIKELKNDPENALNMVDVLSLFTPNGKTKYVELLLRVVKNTKDISLVADEIKKWLRDEYGVDESRLSDFTPFQLFVLHRFVTSSFESDDLKKFIKFCEYNERGLISKNDVTTYDDFDQIIEEFNKANEKVEEKELEKQIHKIYDDGEWMSIRPLTFQASLKYGSNTKWCTAMQREVAHFIRYTKRGILIYNINRNTGVKVAVFYSLDSEHEFSFWNQEDTRIDSLESGLPQNILSIIHEEIKNNKVPNFNLLNEQEQKTQEALKHERSKMSSLLAGGLGVPEQPINEIREEEITTEQRDMEVEERDMGMEESIGRLEEAMENGPQSEQPIRLR
jgi:hypothetical protein